MKDTLLDSNEKERRNAGIEDNFCHCFFPRRDDEIYGGGSQWNENWLMEHWLSSYHKEYYPQRVNIIDIRAESDILAPPDVSGRSTRRRVFFFSVALFCIVQEIHILLFSVRIIQTWRPNKSIKFKPLAERYCH